MNAKGIINDTNKYQLRRLSDVTNFIHCECVDSQMTLPAVLSSSSTCIPSLFIHLVRSNSGRKDDVLSGHTFSVTANKQRFTYLKVCRELSSRFQWPSGIRRGLRPLASWDCSFEFRRGHGCLSRLTVVCWQVEISATGRLLVQRSRTVLKPLTENHSAWCFLQRNEPQFLWVT